MSHPYQLETPDPTDSSHQERVGALIEKLLISVDVLVTDIQQEEARSGILEDDPAYPLLARHLRSREQNLRATIACLQLMLPSR